MKMFLSKPIRRFAALAILGFVLFSIQTFVVAPAFSFLSARRDHIESQVAKLSRYKDLLASEENIRTQKNELESRLFNTGLLRKGDAPAMVAANIQSQVRRVIGNLGGTVQSTADLPIEEKKSLKRIGVHVNCEGDILVLIGILISGKTDRPLWFIDNLSVRAPDLVQSPKTLEKLTIGFDAYGYVLGDAS